MPLDRLIKIHQILTPFSKRSVHLSNAPKSPFLNLDLLPLSPFLGRIRPFVSVFFAVLLKQRKLIQSRRGHRNKLVPTFELERSLLARDDPLKMSRRGFGGR